jgi:hypothetical protein
MGGNHQNWVFHRGKTPWVFQPSAGSEVPQWPSGQWRLRTRRGQGETEVGKDQNLWVPIGIPYIYIHIYIGIPSRKDLGVASLFFCWYQK